MSTPEKVGGQNTGRPLHFKKYMSRVHPRIYAHHTMTVPNLTPTRPSTVCYTAKETYCQRKNFMQIIYVLPCISDTLLFTQRFGFSSKEHGRSPFRWRC